MPLEVNHRLKSHRRSRVLDLSGREYGSLYDRPAFATIAENEASTYYSGGSAILEGLVRFGLATFGAHIAWLAAVASQLGEFEIWLAMTAGFAIALALSTFGYARGFVHVLAAASRRTIVMIVAISGVCLAIQFVGW